MSENREHLVHIPVHSVTLEGALAVPARARGVVVFAHGSGSGRHSPRNLFVAQALRTAGLGTLLFDPLSPEEEVAYEARFDIALLTRRLIAVTQWLLAQPATSSLNIGYFGASTGTAATLRAAATLGSAIKAVVSRGGRPDLAWSALKHVHAPTLLIVGGNDQVVLELNREAHEHLKAEKRLVIIPGAGHLFEEPGALQAVARLTSQWFTRYLHPEGHTVHDSCVERIPFACSTATSPTSGLAARAHNPKMEKNEGPLSPLLQNRS